MFHDNTCVQSFTFQTSPINVTWIEGILHIQNKWFLFRCICTIFIQLEFEALLVLEFLGSLCDILPLLTQGSQERICRSEMCTGSFYKSIYLGAYRSIFVVVILYRDFTLRNFMAGCVF